jgi:predicted Zn finger-like uncharacterized protein
VKISCPNCSAAYELDDARVPPSGLSIKCPKCKNPFTVHKPKPGETGKVRSPAAAAPAPQPAGRPAPPKMSPAGAVPLPGTGETKAAIAPPSGAVPLPGLDGAERPSPPMPKSSAPAFDDSLPGFDDPMPAPAPARAAAKPAAMADDDPFGNIDIESSGPKAAAPTRAAPGQDFSLDGETAVAPKSSAPVAAPPMPKSSAPAANDMLDFVDDDTAVAPKAAEKDKKKRPPPPTLAKSDGPAEGADEDVAP